MKTTQEYFFTFPPPLPIPTPRYISSSSSSYTSSLFLFSLYLPLPAYHPTLSPSYFSYHLLIVFPVYLHRCVLLPLHHSLTPIPLTCSFVLISLPVLTTRASGGTTKRPHSTNHTTGGGGADGLKQRSSCILTFAWGHYPWKLSALNIYFRRLRRRWSGFLRVLFHIQGAEALSSYQ